MTEPITDRPITARPGATRPGGGSSVALFRDPGDGAHVTRLPAWVAPKGGGRYWHAPRSATITADYLGVRFWCGQGGRVADDRLTLEPPEDMKCGTCLGRRAGYDREQGAVFRPRDHWKPPTRCPGNGWEAPEYKLCPACGEKVQAARGWNAWGSATHRPGPGLSERLLPCPNHGWKDIRHRSDDTFTCGTWRCCWVAGP